MIYELLPHQVDFLESKAVHTGLVGGFGCGKTFSGVLKTVAQLMANPSKTFGYYLPTYSHIRDIAFPRISDVLDNQNIDYQLNKSHKVFETALGNIIMRSMDTPESIIGYETAYALIDEADTIPMDKMKDAFKNIVARNRLPLSNGEVNKTDFVSTPEGFGFLYHFFIKNSTSDRVLIKGKTRDNIFLPPSFIETLKSSYTPQQLEAYLNGEFVNLNAETVFYGFKRSENASQKTIHDSNSIHIGMDFNIGNMSAVAHIIIGKEIHAVDEVVKVFDTPQMCLVLKERYRGKKITIYPDASGGNRKTVGASDIQYLRNEGFTVVTGSSNPLVRDRITVANTSFCDGKGVRSYFINLNECPNYVDALEKLAYKGGEPDKSSGFDHVTDAGTYCVYYLKKNKGFDNVNL